MAKQTKPKGAERDGVLLWTWILAAAVILLTVYVRIRLLNVPLERDEGEFAYMGRLILKGIVPYKVACSMKLPGIYAIYALTMAIFGQTEVGIRIGLLLANLSAAVLVFALARRLWNTQTALVAASGYLILTLGRPVIGLAAHATQFQMPMVLGAIILLLRALESDRKWLLLWSGLMMGLAFITKQQAVLFVVFGGCYLLCELMRSRRLAVLSVIRRVALYAAGAAIPFAAVCAIVLASGSFEKFWFWTFTYAHEYALEMPLGMGLSTGMRIVEYQLGFILLLAILMIVGLFAIWYDVKLRAHALFATTFLIFSFLATGVGLYFREHYFVMVMPAASLLIGLAISWLGRALSKRRSQGLRLVPLIIFAIAVAQVVFQSRELFFKAGPVDAIHIVYEASPFPEAIRIARYLKEHTRPDEKIVVLGSEPEIYFYADRPAGTGFIYTYGLAEKQPYAKRMQEDMIAEIEAVKPKYIVYANITSSWLFTRGADQSIIFWFARYASRHYKIAALADIISCDRTDYYWGEEAEYFAPDATESLIVFERKDL